MGLNTHRSGLSSVAVIGIVTAVAVIVFGVLIWFAMRDTWERDHAAEVRDSAALVQRLSADRKIDDAHRCLDELNSLVGDRELKDPALRDGVLSARQALTKAKEEETSRKERGGRLAASAAAVKAADAVVLPEAAPSALTALKGVRENLKGYPRNDTEVVSSIAAIDAQVVRLGALVDAKRRDDERAATAAEERSRMASTKGRVRGGAWVIKKAGNSEPLRGLRVRLVRTSATNADLLTANNVQLASAKSSLEFHKDHIKTLEGNLATYPNSEGFKKLLAETKVGLADVEAEIALLEGKQREIAARPGAQAVEMESVLKTLGGGRSALGERAWAAIVVPATIAEGTTDVEGKYEVPVTGGEYLAVATFQSDISTIEWIVPVRVSTAEGVKLDLFNENAFYIFNKKH